jgi:hypothetical protein
MATRHLYHVEDISATLLVAIQQNQRRIAKDAAAELVASHESDLLFRLLTLAWLLDEPDSPYQYQRAKAFEARDIEALLGSLLQAGYELPDCEALLEVPKPPPIKRGSPAGILKGWTAGEVRALWTLITSSMAKRQWRRVGHLLCPHVQTHSDQVVSWLRLLGVSEPLASLVKTTAYLPLAHRIVRHALASLCSQPLEPKTVALSNASGRSLTLLPDALAQWNCDTRPLSNLVGSPHWIAEEPTLYWSSLLADTKGRLQEGDLVFETEEGEESLYSQGFPMDIPDEWSDEERKKSHGLEYSKIQNPWQFAFDACWI